MAKQRSDVRLHVVGEGLMLSLGTRYTIDISQYKFLSVGLVGQVSQFSGYPGVIAGFVCSVPGLQIHWRDRSEKVWTTAVLCCRN